MVYPTRAASVYHILANEACRQVCLEGVEGSTKSSSNRYDSNITERGLILVGRDRAKRYNFVW